MDAQYDARYEVCLRGSVSDRVLRTLGAEWSPQEPDRTVLHTGPMDQAALYGLLVRIQACGLELVEVRRRPGSDEPGRAETAL